MKKTKILKIMMVIFMVIFVFGNVYATYSRPVDPSTGTNVIDGLTTRVDKIWATIILIVQILSVACFAFAGIRYMFASADQKADLKKGLMYLAIGSVFVFAASTVIRFLFDIGSSVIN